PLGHLADGMAEFPRLVDPRQILIRNSGVRAQHATKGSKSRIKVFRDASRFTNQISAATRHGEKNVASPESLLLGDQIGSNKHEVIEIDHTIDVVCSENRQVAFRF